MQNDNNSQLTEDHNVICNKCKCIRKHNEFKQFLINFAVLGLLISTDQMNWIFNKIAKEKQKDRRRRNRTK